MSYKVFLVEDEKIIREGIRDKVDWKSAGFEFCGEAQDGEVALPLIEKTQPDVLITDIKMPFMDGLQLSKVVASQMPWVKIIILSGHDEFEYAQSAIKLGVYEYLLKPINAIDIQKSLKNLAAILDQEREDSANLKELQNQVKDVLTLKRERLLLQLVVGGISSSEAIEQYGRIGLTMIAQHYMVILIKVNPYENDGHLDLAKHNDIQDIVTNLISMYSGAFFTQKSVEELLLIMTGDDPEQLRQDGLFLAELVKKDIEESVGCKVTFGVGSIQERLANIHLSFVDALAIVNNSGQKPALGAIYQEGDLLESLKLDQSAVDHYLRTGLIEEYDNFFQTYLRPISEAAQYSTLIKHYLFADIIFTSAQLISDLGGEPLEVIPEMKDMESFLVGLESIDQIRDALRSLTSEVLAYRNNQVKYGMAKPIFQAKEFIDNNFSDPDLLLENVAAQVNLSPSHFSVVFSREIGESFKDYLTRIRIERAQELLRTTNLKCSEIAYQSGYKDPHYFSYVFKKNTGIPPQQFRQLSQV